MVYHLEYYKKGLIYRLSATLMAQPSGNEKAVSRDKVAGVSACTSSLILN